MKILVTGHEGFIGQNFVNSVLNKHEIAGWEWNSEKHSIWRFTIYLYSFSKHSCQSFSRQSNGEVRKKILRILDN